MGDTAEFSAGLLDPQHPVPLLIKGQVERRYSVYRNNVTVSLMRALEANFPVVRRLLGEQYFAGFAREFAHGHPPQSPMMFQYGADFPAALENSKDLSSYPYLGDVARLEILWRQSYHAADAPTLAADGLASVDPEALFDSRLIIHPAARLIRSRFAIHSIFAANTGEGDAHVFDPAQPQCAMVTRPQYEVTVYAVSLDQFEFFLALKNGGTLGAALDCAAGIDENFDLSGSLALLLRSGAFQSIQTDNRQTT